MSRDLTVGMLIPSAVLAEPTSPFAHLTLAGEPNIAIVHRVAALLDLSVSRDDADRLRLVARERCDGTHPMQAVRLFMAAVWFHKAMATGAELHYVSRLHEFLTRVTGQGVIVYKPEVLTRPHSSRGSVVLGAGVSIHLSEAGFPIDANWGPSTVDGKMLRQIGMSFGSAHYQMRVAA